MNATHLAMEEAVEIVLVNKAAQGDLDAFNQLVIKHQDMAYRHALLMLSDSWLAEDVVQEYARFSRWFLSSLVDAYRYKHRP